MIKSLRIFLQWASLSLAFQEVQPWAFAVEASGAGGLVSLGDCLLMSHQPTRWSSPGSSFRVGVSQSWKASCKATPRRPLGVKVLHQEDSRWIALS